MMLDRYLRVMNAKIVLCCCGIPFVDAYAKLHTTSQDHQLNLKRMQKLGMEIPQSKIIGEVGSQSGRKIVHVDRTSLENEEQPRQRNPVRLHQQSQEPNYHEDSPDGSNTNLSNPMAARQAQMQMDENYQAGQRELNAYYNGTPLMIKQFSEMFARSNQVYHEDEEQERKKQ